MMMIQYLLDTGAEVTTPGIAAPRTTFADVVEPVALALGQEREVSEQINALAATARDERDFAAEQFLAVVRLRADRGGRDDERPARTSPSALATAWRRSRTTSRASTPASRVPTRRRPGKPAASSPAEPLSSGCVDGGLTRAYGTVSTSTLTVQRRLMSRVQGRSCVGQTVRNRHHRACVRWVTVGVSFNHRDIRGVQRFRLPHGVIAHRPAGRYRLVATPHGNGLTGRSVTVSFRLLRR